IRDYRAVTQRPMIAAPFAGSRSAHQRSPKNDQDIEAKNRPGKSRKSPHPSIIDAVGAVYDRASFVALQENTRSHRPRPQKARVRPVQFSPGFSAWSMMSTSTGAFDGSSFKPS